MAEGRQSLSGVNDVPDGTLIKASPGSADVYMVRGDMKHYVSSLRSNLNAVAAAAGNAAGVGSAVNAVAGAASVLQALAQSTATTNAGITTYNPDVAARKADAAAIGADWSSFRSRFGPYLSSQKSQAVQITDDRLVPFVMPPFPGLLLQWGPVQIASRTADFLHSAVASFHASIDGVLTDMLNHLNDLLGQEDDAMAEINAVLGACDHVLG
jgi:hypothetical protein